jgi:hypothetical protein
MIERADLGRARRELHALERVEVVGHHADDRQLLRLGVELHREHPKLRGQLVRHELEQRVRHARARELLRGHELGVVERGLEVQQRELVEQTHLDQRFFDVYLPALRIQRRGFAVGRLDDALGHERIEELRVDARERGARL